MSGNFCFSCISGDSNVANEVETKRKNKNYLSRPQLPLSVLLTVDKGWDFWAEKVWASYQFLAQAHFLSFHVKIDHDCIMSEGLWCRFGKLHNKFRTFQRLFWLLDVTNSVLHKNVIRMPAIIPKFIFVTEFFAFESEGSWFSLLVFEQ